jgi:glycerol kinase
MERVADEPLSELRADGGATANGWLMQFQADVLGVPIAVAEIAETTALGAALLAGVGVGAWTQADIAAREGERARFEPRMGEDERDGLIADWRRAVQVARAYARG